MSTTPCPDCGEPMPMVTWTGEKPTCMLCSGGTVTHVGIGDVSGISDDEDDTMFFMDEDDRDYLGDGPGAFKEKNPSAEEFFSVDNEYEDEHIRRVQKIIRTDRDILDLLAND